MRRAQQERLTRPVEAKRELGNILKSTTASASREKMTRERINLLFPQHQDQSKSQKTLMKRRRSLDFGDLADLDNLPKLSTPAWRTLV